MDKEAGEEPPSAQWPVYGSNHSHVLFITFPNLLTADLLLQSHTSPSPATCPEPSARGSTSLEVALVAAVYLYRK